MKRISILVLCLTGCAQIEPPLEPVTAVIVQQDDETGDKFYARKSIHGTWY